MAGRIEHATEVGRKGEEAVLAFEVGTLAQSILREGCWGETEKAEDGSYLLTSRDPLATELYQLSITVSGALPSIQASLVDSYDWGANPIPNTAGGGALIGGVAAGRPVNSADRDGPHFAWA